jgi:hypothetical protein
MINKEEVMAVGTQCICKKIRNIENTMIGFIKP